MSRPATQRPISKLGLRQRLRQSFASNSSTVQLSIVSQVPDTLSAGDATSQPISVSTALSTGPTPNNTTAALSSQQQGISRNDPLQTLRERALKCLTPPEHIILQQYLNDSSTEIHQIIEQAITAAQNKRQACLDERWTLSIAGRQIVLKEEANKVVAWLDRFKAVGDVVANADPVHFGLPWVAIRFLLEAATAEANQMACLLVGCETVLYTTSRLEAYAEFAKSIPISLTRDNLDESMVNLYAHILQFLARAIHVYQSSSTRRFFTAFGRMDDVLDFESKVNALATRVEFDANSCGRMLELQQMQQELTNLAQLHRSQMSLDRLHTKFDLGKIPYAKGAIFNSVESVHTMCHAQTRANLLIQIQQWAQAVDSKNIFWLQGAAGAGKSTISWTFSQWLTEQSSKGNVDLGASFFFKRGESDSGSAAKFFATVVRQLVLKIPGLDVPVAKAVEQDPFIFDKALGEQFCKLLKLPLQHGNLLNANLPVLVVVVDALDECSNESDIETILQLWLEVLHTKNSPIKLFLTSRPDPPILQKFRRMPEDLFEDAVLQDIVSPTIIEQDLWLYLRDAFASIREQALLHYSSEQTLDKDWPGNNTLQQLVDMSMPLFIVAATVCRFVGDREFDPLERLSEVLSFGHTDFATRMESTYLPVLSHLTNPMRSVIERKTLCDDFRIIVGSIICLVEPLSALALSMLLDMPVSSIMRRVSPLRSVLQVPSDQLSPIRALHLSFSEFLLSKNLRDQPFGIDSLHIHSVLANHCLQLLSRPDGLRENILNLGNPGTLRRDVEGAVVTNRLSTAFQYACRNWVYHVQHSKNLLTDGDNVHSFLQRHYLHWLEALSFMGRISETVGLLGILRSIVSTASTHLLSYLKDAQRFILTNRHIADLAPLQIYSSALIFAPQESLIQLSSKISEWITQQPKAFLTVWGSELQKLEGHTSNVEAVAFSHDDLLLASASDDTTIRLWNTSTGQELQRLEAHTSVLWSVAFSHDDKLLASTSADRTTRLWNLSTGQEVWKTEGCDFMNRVAFSKNAPLLAFASTDNAIHIWNTATAQETLKIEGHTDFVESLMFFHQDEMLVSAALDGTVRIWSLSSGQEIKKLEGHAEDLTTVAISPNDMLLVSFSLIGTVRLWHLPTASEPYYLDEDGDPKIVSVAFSTDSSLLASASLDGTVQLWDTSTGLLIHELMGHTLLVSTIVFANNSSPLASASGDRTVRLWDLSNIPKTKEPAKQRERVAEVVFSHNGLLLASASYDSKTIRLWNSLTGQIVRTLTGLTCTRCHMVFSHNDLLLAYASIDNTICVRDISTGQKIQQIQGHTNTINGIAFSYDDRLLASASRDKTIRVWNLQSGHELQRLGGTTFRVNPICFSHDNSMLASAPAGSNGRVIIWSLSTGQEVQRIAEAGVYKDQIMATALSHDGSLLALVSYLQDGTYAVRVWDLSRDRLIRTIEGLGYTAGLYFAPNGNQLLTNRGALDIDVTHSLFAKVEAIADLVVYLDHEWVTYKGERVLWLPQDYREVVAVHQNTIAFGHSSGKVGIMRIDPSLLSSNSSSSKSTKSVTDDQLDSSV